MKSITKALAVIVMLVMLASLAACGGSNSSSNSGSNSGSGSSVVSAGESAVVGSWENTDYGYACVFNSDGTGTLTEGETTTDFTYTDNGSAIEVTFAGGSAPQSLDYTLADNTLTIGGIQYTKK